MRFVARSRKHPPDCAGNGAYSWSACGQLPPGVTQPLEQILAAGRLDLGELGEGLDRATRHPAGAVRAIIPKLLDSFG